MADDNLLNKEIISFLKKYQENYENELFSLMNNYNQGVYFIHDEKITFSTEAQKLLKVDESLSLDFFYSQINLQDRNNFIKLLTKKQQEDTPYEFIYRYKLSDENFIWIKEHGIFSFSNKNKRIAIIHDYTKQMNQNNELHRLAYYDKTTDLKNRNYFEKDIRFLHDYKIPFALFIIDINSFKNINDNFGHLYGDVVLKQFSKKLINCFSASTTFDLYRLSGDEFALVFPYVTLKKDTENFVKNIFTHFNQPLVIENHQLSIIPSIGIAFYPKDSHNVNTLVKYADLSMYKAKTESYIHYCYFDREYYKVYKEEKAVEEHIRYLLNQDKITLNYQPIVNCHTNEVVGFEALLNPNSSYKSDVIFNTALKSHLIVELEKYIIEKIFKDLAENNHLLSNDIRFTINLTPKTIHFIDVFELITSLLKKYDVQPEQIGIEITEQYFINDENKINMLIFRLQSLGIKVYLDDFGMGYSSVRNIIYMSYDHIKIDKRLIASIFTNKKCEVFIKYIIAFAKESNCKIIFEGIETREQLEFLKALGAEYIQGYYFSKPQVITEAIKLLK